MCGALEHQVFEEVGESALVTLLVLGTYVVPEIYRHDRELWLLGGRSRRDRWRASFWKTENSSRASFLSSRIMVSARGHGRVWGHNRIAAQVLLWAICLSRSAVLPRRSSGMLPFRRLTRPDPTFRSEHSLLRRPHDTIPRLRVVSRGSRERACDRIGLQIAGVRMSWRQVDSGADCQHRVVV